MLELAQLLMSTAGFGLPLGILLLMSGRVKIRNELDTLIRILSAFCLSMVCSWLVGFGLFSGFSYVGLIGMGQSVGARIEQISSPHDLQTLFMFSVPPILVTAAMAERGNFVVGSVLVAVVALFVVPLSAHWGWTDSSAITGWVAGKGFEDEGGAVVIFASAGFVALAASLTIGPRSGRFPLNSKHPQGHSPTFHVLGAIVMVLSLAFVCAGQAEQVRAMPAVIFKVLLGSCFAFVSAMLLLILRKSKDIAMDLVTAGVAGGIALTAFAPHTAPASAALTGIFAGSFAIGLRRILSAVEIDDPGDLIAMFLSGGLISGLLAPVLWLGGGQGLLNQLVMQLTGIIAISAWSFGVTFLVAQLLFRFAGLRVSEGDEARGLSRVHFDMQSEPDFFLTQFMDNAHTQSGHEQAGKGQLSRLAIIFSQSIVDLRTETHRATERILSMSPDAKHGVAMAARIRLAENTLRVKSEDILLLLGGALDCDKMAVNGAGFLRWAKNVLEILMEPALRDLEQFTRHLPLQAELEELENIILAAADTVERCAHQVDLLGDLSDSQKQGFFSRDHKCDLAALLQEQSTLLQTLADIHNSPIQIDCPVDAGLIVAGDANAFKRILTLSAEGALNRLLSKDGKPVRIELREHTSGRHIVFECLDTGSALTARQIRAIIDPTTENHALEELGLPQILPLMLVARLVDAIGGELSLSSEHGLGTMLQCRFRMLHSI